MAARKSTLWVPERSEMIFIQYRTAVGEEMPDDLPLLASALERLDTMFGICKR